jgi:uncharacterized protein (DUF488 family)
MDGLKKAKGSWEAFEQGFLALMAERQVERQLSRGAFETPSVLLCSEASADRCHRRLVCEYLARRWPDVQAVHL